MTFPPVMPSYTKKMNNQGALRQIHGCKAGAEKIY